MTLATVELSESNGAGETVTDGISNANFGSNDSANLTAATYPITPGNSGYEKWLRLHVSAMNDTTKVDNLRFYKSAGTLPGSTTLYYATVNVASYSTPATTNLVATTSAPTSLPGSANVNIAGSLSGSLTATGYSDYCVVQLRTDAGDTTSGSVTLTFAYDEVT